MLRCASPRQKSRTSFPYILRQVYQAEEVAEAYIYLLKDTNATGSLINTNGGNFL